MRVYMTVRHVEFRERESVCVGGGGGRWVNLLCPVLFQMQISDDTVKASSDPQDLSEDVYTETSELYVCHLLSSPLCVLHKMHSDTVNGQFREKKIFIAIDQKHHEH